MAHFAKIGENGVVETVIVAEQDFIDTLEGTWIQTSYNTYHGRHIDPVTKEPDGGTPLRMNYASIGGTYDAELDAFIPEKPYDSWTLFEGTCSWEPPIDEPVETQAMIDEGDFWVWDEEAYQEDNTTGWVLASDFDAKLDD
jgi:hypothetical protein